MPTRDNTRVVQQGFDAFQSGDIDRLLENLSNDIDWEVLGTPDDLPGGGHRQGKEEVRQFFAEIAETMDFSTFAVDQMVSEGDHVVALGHSAGTVKTTGRPFSTRWAMDFIVRDGKVTGFREYNDTAAIFEAYGVSLERTTRPDTRPREQPS